ncbi:MAG: putative oxidoreductase [Fimbriimonadaceae bacterium]|jgi:putative oxidoreductase|nr:putative oxidoreductase [Fimbriimonadaceae bacterium]
MKNRDVDLSLLIMRLILGGVMFAHASQKVFGWFGGMGFERTAAAFQSGGMPEIVALLVIFGEFFSAIGLITGTLTRASALGIIAIMAGAIIGTHLPNGLFMNWFGNQKGEGFEFHLLAIGMAIPLAAIGAGAYSIDYWIAHMWRRKTPVAGVQAGPATT